MNEILTTGVLQTIIICISSLIALYCIASIIKNLWGKKDDRKICHLEKKNNCETCYEKKHLLYKLIVVFLVFLLVILFSHKFYAYDNIFNFMSFASAIISIILAVLTIIYSYYTNGTTSSSVEKMGGATKKIEATLLKVNEATQSYKESADSLKNNIATLLSTISHVDQTTEKILTAQGINNISNSRALNEAMKPDIVNNFVSLSSLAGNILMYASIKACDKKVNLVLNSIWNEKEIEYCVGFLIAAKSAGLFNLKVHAHIDKKEVEIQEYNPALKEALESLFSKKNNQYYKKMITKINNLFNN